MDTTNVYQDIEHIVSRPTVVPWNNPPVVPPANAAVPIHIQLETARIRQMWTVPELANLVHMRPALLDKFETGSLVPDVCAMHLLCTKLGLTLQ